MLVKITFAASNNDMKRLSIFYCFAVGFILSTPLMSQEADYGRSSIRTGLGFGFNKGKRETGLGLQYVIGWQKEWGEKRRLRFNPNMMIGGYTPLFISGTREQFYRVTHLEVIFHYDLLKVSSVSLVVSGGGFVAYSRGLLGTGGDGETYYDESKFFLRGYFGGSFSAAIRIAPKSSRWAGEIRPVNLQYGNEGFIMTYFMLGVDFKIRKKE